MCVTSYELPEGREHQSHVHRGRWGRIGTGEGAGTKGKVCGLEQLPGGEKSPLGSGQKREVQSSGWEAESHSRLGGCRAGAKHSDPTTRAGKLGG